MPSGGVPPVHRGAGGLHRGHRDGHVEHPGPVRQPRHLRVPVRRALEELREAELRVHRVQALFHHPRPSSHAAGSASPDDHRHRPGCHWPPSVHLCPEMHPHWQHGGLCQSQHDTDLRDHVHCLRYTFGAALFVGWVAGGLTLVGGVMMCIACRGLAPEETNYKAVSYHASGHSVAYKPGGFKASTGFGSNTKNKKIYDGGAHTEDEVQSYPSKHDYV
ncbi:claudin-18 isoform X3 [Piliocolobus tephrosceles]|uniref:claudin-18 isoform X3 n=1 Tax=Piliocolobus tephrosceles TaxID=591936 RepID=UPI000C29E2C8|nr:claudin-18 isoform X3 [Piliocolobus tephrosceles]